MALSLPETSEESHMEHPDFRVGGKIFATLGYPRNGWAMVKLTPEQQDTFMKAEPEVFVPVKGGWGRRGATNVILRAATKATLRRALVAAWRKTAPKRLAERFKE
ncbi:MAG TPA: MmcQ/YjbR family DNA-binding protein [Candidatus Acidoferrales bacterium]